MFPLKTRVKHSLMTFGAIVIFVCGLLTGIHSKVSNLLGRPQDALTCIKDYAPVIQTIIALIGVTLVVFQVRRIAKNARLQHEWNVRKATLDIIGNNQVIKEEYTAIKDARKKVDPTFLKSYNKLDYPEPDFEHHLRHVLNYFEAIAAGIMHGVYHDKIAYDSIRSMVCKMYDFSEPFIESERKTKNPKACEMMGLKVTEWKARKDPPTVPTPPIEF